MGPSFVDNIYQYEILGKIVHFKSHFILASIVISVDQQKYYLSSNFIIRSYQLSSKILVLVCVKGQTWGSMSSLKARIVLELVLLQLTVVGVKPMH